MNFLRTTVFILLPLTAFIGFHKNKDNVGLFIILVKWNFREITFVRECKANKSRRDPSEEEKR